MPSCRRSWLASFPGTVPSRPDPLMGRTQSAAKFSGTQDSRIKLMMYGELIVFSGRAHPRLAREIAAFLNLPLGKVSLKNFSDGEINCQLDQNVRGSDCFQGS